MDTISTNRKKRSERGLSVVEMIVALIIMVSSLAVLSEISFLITKSFITTSNRVEGLDAARNAMRRILVDVRAARSIGDYYGLTGNDKLQFPSSQNPVYGSSYGSNPPPGGWPAAPWPFPLRLTDSTLVMQIPVTYKSTDHLDGMPLILTSPNKMENLDTVVYTVVPDVNRKDEYILQVARFPGKPNSNWPSTADSFINPPQTVLKGLIGPFRKNSGGSSPPSIFSYLTRQNNQAPITLPGPGNVSNITGISIDFEIKKTGLSTPTGDGQFPQWTDLHSEAFMRSNHNMTLNNAY